MTTLLLSFLFHLPSSQDPRKVFHKWSNHYCLCTMTHCSLFWLLQLNSVSPISQVVQIPVQTEFSYLKTPPISSFKNPTGFSVVKNFPMSQQRSGIWAQHIFSLLALLKFISVCLTTADFQCLPLYYLLLKQPSCVSNTSFPNLIQYYSNIRYCIQEHFGLFFQKNFYTK